MRYSQASLDKFRGTVYKALSIFLKLFEKQK